MITTIIIIAAAIVVAAVLAYAAGKPDTFMVSRTALIAARPEQIFPMIDDLHAQSAWSPFEKDPNMKRTHSGAPRGKGAVYAWDGNRQVGAGRIAIRDSVPPSNVTLLLDMERPFKAHNTVEFTLVRGGSDTSVTWMMQGRQPFMAKLMGLVMNCDKMVGSQFEEGLGKLKKLVEAQPAVAAE
jgi:polyketide cyclase/dehydrase/lipid transport protein